MFIARLPKEHNTATGYQKQYRPDFKETLFLFSTYCISSSTSDDKALEGCVLYIDNQLTEFLDVYY